VFLGLEVDLFNFLIGLSMKHWGVGLHDLSLFLEYYNYALFRSIKCSLPITGKIYQLEAVEEKGK